MDKHNAHLWDSIRRLFHRHFGPTDWQRFRAQITPNAPANETKNPRTQILINPTRLKAMARNMRTPQVSLPSLGVYLRQHGITLPDPVPIIPQTSAAVDGVPILPADWLNSAPDERERLFADIVDAAPVVDDEDTTVACENPALYRMQKMARTKQKGA